MFKQLKSGLQSSIFATAARKGLLACPECGAKPAGVPASYNAVVTCPDCGTKAAAHEWAATATSGTLAGKADRPPADTKITRTSDGSTTVWAIPPSGKSGGFLFFAAFWLAITGTVTAAMAFGDPSYEGEPGGLLLIILFFALFWAIGLGMLYFGLRNRFARHRIEIDTYNLTLRRTLFGRANTKSLSREAITTVHQAEFYQKNYRPVYGIEIKAGKRKIRFGTVLTPGEKAWLVADIKESIFGTTEPPARATPADPAADPDPRSPGKSSFTFPLPSANKHAWAFSIVLILMGLAFSFIAIKLMGPLTGLPDGDDPLFVKIFDLIFTLFDSIFRLIFLLAGLAMSGGGVYWLTKLRATRHHKRAIVGTSSTLYLRITDRHGRVIRETPYPRAQIADVRLSNSGHVNGKPMSRLELIVADEAVPLLSWTDSTQAESLASDLRQALGFA